MSAEKAFDEIAEESPKTKKTREKLKKHFQIMDDRITRQALSHKTLEIHRWIARHASHRTVLKSKSISLFDNNKNAAHLSQKVQLLMKHLQNEIDV